MRVNLDTDRRNSKAVRHRNALDRNAILNRHAPWNRSLRRDAASAAPALARHRIRQATALGRRHSRADANSGRRENQECTTQEGTTKSSRARSTATAALLLYWGSSSPG